MRRKYSKIDFSNLNKKDIFIGDIYKVITESKFIEKYGLVKCLNKYNLIKKNTILLKIDDETFINLDKIKMPLDKDYINLLLSNEDMKDKNGYFIKKYSFKANEKEYFVNNLRSIDNLKCDVISFNDLYENIKVLNLKKN